MAETTYPYSISQDFPQQAVDSTLLTAQIEASAIVGVLERIDTAGDVCDIVFEDALSGGDVTILDGLVAAHVPPVLYEDRRPAVMIMGALSQSFTLGTTWEEAGGVIFAPDEFDADPSACAMRIEGFYNTDGVQADVRLLEDGLEKGTLALPDSSAADAVLDWTLLFSPSSGACVYKLQARQGTATTCKLGLCTLTLRHKF